VTGVTGARTSFGPEASFDRFLERVRRGTRKRFVVGFGVSTPEHVREIWRFADGAVVGSAIIRAMEASTDIDDAVERAGTFFRTLHPT
jgi:tryptophan synthase alpha chain